MGLHACVYGKWDGKHVIAFRWVKDEVSWHGNKMWKMTMLSHEKKQKQVFGKKLVISPSGEKPANKHKTPNTKTQRTFKNNSNMSRCNALQSLNSKFGLRKELKTWKWMKTSY